MATQGINLFRVLMTWLAPVMPGIAAKAEAWLGQGSLSDWNAVARPMLGTAIGKYPQLATRLDPKIVKELVATAPAAAAPRSPKESP